MTVCQVSRPDIYTDVLGDRNVARITCDLCHKRGRPSPRDPGRAVMRPARGAQPLVSAVGGISKWAHRVDHRAEGRRSLGRRCRQGPASILRGCPPDFEGLDRIVTKNHPKG
ncbi:hypothetical protein GCM10011509_29480 [Ornithinimicrobium pekingense]|uniref:Uncharacterized protein n=1 Tax=Ornithinimicrobium pekingense TaxID=384677 RepID=A0ABQ2FE78_9MICO|nr:hypothetical protein GCM10011509_29480 [Ornithinimicrobium pekingense]